MASCAICDKPALFRCGKCKVERYCSRECQKDHWPHHKTRCAELGAAAKAAADRPSPAPAQPAPDATGSSTPHHLQTQPQPQPPPHSAYRDRSASFRGNPRASRLLREIPPSLEGAVAAEEAEAGSATATSSSTSITVTGSGDSVSGGGGGVSRGAAAASTASAADGGPRAGAPQGTDDGGGGGCALNTPQHTPPRLAPHPPPLGPRTPLPTQPAPPLGSPQPQPPAGRASAVFVRPQLRGTASVPAAAGAAGGLLVEGRGGFLRSGASVGSGGAGGGGGGSILDRVLQPPPPPPPPPGPAATTAAEVRVGAQQQPQPGQSQQGTSADAASNLEPAACSELDAAGSVAGQHHAALEQQPQQQKQQVLQWPWATRSVTEPPGGGAAAATVAAAAAAAGACLSDLPPEVLLEVLKALPARSLATAAAVCRSWRRAAREPWLWVRQLCAAGYPLPAAAYVAHRHAAAPAVAAVAAAAVGGAVAHAVADGCDGGGDGGGAAEAARAVPGVRGIRAVRAVRAAGGSSHDDFLGGLRAGFLDRLQQQQQQQGQQGQQAQHGQHGQHGPQGHGHGREQPQAAAAAATAAQSPPPDLKGLYGRTVRMESNWRSARYAETELREHSSNVECLAFQRVEPWGSVLLSAAWDGSVRVFSLGPPSGAPQQARCVRRYRGHTGWITCMAAGRHQVVTASTDRRVAAWRYYSESSDPWVALEHPQEVTLVRFCYAPPLPTTTHYLAHHIHQSQSQSRDRGGKGRGSLSETATGAAAGAAGTTAGTTVGTTMTPGGAGMAVERLDQTEEGLHEDGRQEVVRSGEAAAALLPYDPRWEDWVLSGCIDGVIRLWHLPTKQLLRTFSGHGDVVWGISVLHGSGGMVSSSRDGTTKLWQLPPYSSAQAAITPPAPGDGTAGRSVAGGGDEAGGAAGGAGPAEAAGAQMLEAVATLCGHTSAILCMDVHRVPPGMVPPAPGVAAAAADAADAGGGGGGGASARPGPALGRHQSDMRATLANLLNTCLVEPAAAAGGGGGGGSGDDDDAASTAAAAAASAPPIWLVATGGADAVVRVWNLATAQCHSTLRGHSVGVLSVQFGYLPRAADSHRDGQLLPASLDVSAAVPPPPLALPPGQYGIGPGGRGRGRCRGRGPHPRLLPPSQRLVLVTGSVREVRVWDPVSGSALAQLSDHSGPVTSVALVHGALVTLAMNDGLIVYKCNGMDGAEAETASAVGAGAGSGAEAPAAGTAATAAAAAFRPISATGRLRREGVAPHRRPLEPIVCLQDAPHRSFSAALSVQLEGLAVGSGTGDIHYLDFRPRASPLPLLHARRRLQL